MNYPPEVQEALDKAVKKYGPNLEGAYVQADLSNRRTPKGHAVRPPAAFESGKKAKHYGFARVTPYYEAAKSDYFWFAGFDGKTMEEAIATQ